MFEYSYQKLKALELPKCPMLSPRKCRSVDEAQALANFCYKEILRHGNDIDRGLRDLEKLEAAWGVKPCAVEWVDP